MLPTSPTQPQAKAMHPVILRGECNDSTVAEEAGLAFNTALSFLSHKREPTVRLESGDRHRDDLQHQLLPKGRCIGKAEQISDGAPNLPFLLEHKFTAAAGAASFNNLQKYNQIIIFVMVRVLHLSRIIQTEALDGSRMLTT